MKEFLFLYPIQEYFMHPCAYTVHDYANYLPHVSATIDARYRNQGYGINWLLFDNKEGDPDLQLLAPEFSVPFQDRVIGAGVTFLEHTTECKYPDPKSILRKLPAHQRLVIGGFHLDDCVDKVAEASYSRGVDTFVDEDLTNHGFSMMRQGKVPLMRTEWTLAALGWHVGFSYCRRTLMRERRDKPWLTREVGEFEKE